MLSYQENTLPHKTGVGFKTVHLEDIPATHKHICWYEIHPENYMVEGGYMLHALERIRENYPISMHGVGLSIGANKPLDKEHLQRFKRLIDRFQPSLISEHLAWSSHEEVFLNDLLPLPYNNDTLKIVSDHISEMQDTLGRTMLLENPSTYLTYKNSDMEETEFLKTLAQKTGCGLLLDVNNVYVSAHNNGYDAYHYIDNFPHTYIGEIHLGGHHIDTVDKEDIIIDSHSDKVADEVWKLFDYTMQQIGTRPVLVEWDGNIPEFSELEKEAERATSIMMKSQLINA